ncbi:MAG: hypothetical protein JNN30_18990 [Rhodanobacteraceae bacterium]|nr:hypothetical protein [Rhodanobacteraceae bacterium]
MFRLITVVGSVLWAAGALSAQPAPGREATSQRFECADTLDRADGQPRKSVFCDKRSEYCFEASGGTPLSHGAKCLPLPRPGASCKDLVLEPGSQCTGDASSGIRVDFAFP